jgi:lipopolysaccharide/colanic/teichoic acid biosynthesis glycosyltransferase
MVRRHYKLWSAGNYEAESPGNFTSNRVLLVEELYQRYGQGSQKRFLYRLRFLQKKYSWIAVVGCTNLLKRLIDIAGAGALLLALMPLFIVVAIAVKSTGGPVLFWQTRVGLWGSEFPFPKFRSMVVNAEQLKATLLAQNQHGSGVTFKMKKDPRITWIGRIIRKFSIDELPQLWCVLNGDMSLVGPRPPLPAEVLRYSLNDRRRLDVKPGLTCIWQVSGRSDIPFDKQVQLDLAYINSRSVSLDILLLLRTVPAILTGRGAY